MPSILRIKQRRSIFTAAVIDFTIAVKVLRLCLMRRMLGMTFRYHHRPWGGTMWAFGITTGNWLGRESILR
jgi:hypothetical protein